MASKKDNLPTNVDFDLENGGTIKYANEVIAIIAGVAASEVDGIAGMCTSGGISDIIGRNRNITRGVKVEIGGEEASVELYIVVEYGSPIQKVASEVQENVRKAIETMTGLHVVNVDVHVQGVSFEREKKALQSGLESAHLTSEENARIQDEARQALREEEAAAKEEPAKDGEAEADPRQEPAEEADTGEDTEG
ncbi:MAG: Asp23/Gls24 family envelope stress response protein [Clostridia bacterium]|nr:Asp23/Gls24 family envelope stress response protein [Clostridia bacterium]